MNFNRLTEILGVAKTIHSSLRGDVDFTNSNKKHAIYLLQGGVLTAVTSALKFNLEGYIVPVAQQKRMIDEAIDLIWFFDEIEENSRHLRAWFNGHIVERVPGNRGNLTLEERSERNFLTTEQIRRMDNLGERLSRLVSRYMHPSIDAVRANSRRVSHTFDYNHEQTSSASFPAGSFGNLYVIPGLHALLIPARTLPLLQNDFEQLRTFDREIQNS